MALTWIGKYSPIFGWNLTTLTHKTPGIVLQVDDMIPADPSLAHLLEDPSSEPPIDAYNCLVSERGDFTLHDFTNKQRRKLDNIAKQAIMHQLLKGVQWLHSRGVYKTQWYEIKTENKKVSLAWLNCYFIDSAHTVLFDITANRNKTVEGTSTVVRSRGRAHASIEWRETHTWAHISTYEHTHELAHTHAPKRKIAMHERMPLGPCRLGVAHLPSDKLVCRTQIASNPLVTAGACSVNNTMQGLLWGRLSIEWSLLFQGLKRVYILKSRDRDRCLDVKYWALVGQWW